MIKAKKKKREILTSEQLGANYNKFMAGKELNPNGLELFDKAIKKAVTTKKRDLK